jgi:predicted nucleotidyltransferase
MKHLHTFEDFLNESSELEKFRKLALRQLKSSKMGEKIKRDVESLVGKSAVEGVYIIGSVLEPKKFTEESDIDIAVMINVPDMKKGSNEEMSYEFSQTYALPDAGFVDITIWNITKPLGEMIKIA